MNYLIVRFSAIGDCVMAAHVPSRIRRSEADAWIGWAVERRCAAVVDAERLCTARFEIPRDQWRKQRLAPAVWRQQMAYYARLRRERFDVGLDLQGHLKTAVCLRLAKPRRRLAIQATDALAKALNPVMDPLPGTNHCVELALHCLRQIGDYPGDSKPIMPPLPAERERIRAMVPAGKPLATIAVNAGQWDKAYPLEKWIPVAEALVAEGMTVAFLGGPESQAPSVAGTLDWVGQLPLEETMAAIALSSVHLAGDTGAGHIAGAYDVPGVSVFGPTDPARFRPYSDTVRVLRKGTATANVEPAAVIEAAMEQLRTYGRAIPH